MDLWDVYIAIIGITPSVQIMSRALSVYIFPVLPGMRMTLGTIFAQDTWHKTVKILRLYPILNKERFVKLCKKRSLLYTALWFEKCLYACMVNIRVRFATSHFIHYKYNSVSSELDPGTAVINCCHDLMRRRFTIYSAFLDIKNSISWYQVVHFPSWYQDIHFLISKNRIPDINKSFLDIDNRFIVIKKSIYWWKNESISTSTSQTFRSWVAIFHFRQPMVFLSHSSYGMPGLAPLMNSLF